MKALHKPEYRQNAWINYKLDSNFPKIVTNYHYKSVLVRNCSVAMDGDKY